jgi:subtilisin family serine protease
MSRHHHVVRLVSLGMALSPATTSAEQRLAPVEQRPPSQESVPGEIVVQFDETAPAPARGEARRAAGVGAVRAMRRSGQQLVKVEDGRSVAAAIRALEADPRVRYAEPNYIYGTTEVPDDPLFGQLWGLRNTGQLVKGVPGTAGVFGADIAASAGWDRLTGSSGATVAVVDSGVAYDHPDLDGNIWANPGEVPNGADDDGNGFVDDIRGYDFIGNDADPRDLNGHGTHVAGTIGAEGNNGAGVTGVNWDVSLMPVRVLNAGGSGSNAAVTDGFDYAGDEGAQVVNASLGGGGFSQAMSDAITSHPDTLYVVAAGNGGADGIGDDNELVPQFPCNYTAANMICVAATTQSDALAGFSNFGTTSVDLGAPGTNILSTQPSFGFQDGFEVDDITTRWVREGTAQWNRIGTSANAGAFSVADSPGGDYAPNANAILRTSAAVPLNGEACRIAFDFRLESEVGIDGFFVETSPNNVTWTIRDSFSGSTGGSFVGRNVALPTSATAQFVRFRFVSNGTNQQDGAYLDEIRLGCVDGVYDGGEFAFFNGTSMATPHVAGAAALAFAAHPRATVAEVRSGLLETGDQLGALVGKTVTGRRLDLLNALLAIGPGVSTLEATSIEITSATLNGIVNPFGTDTSYQFEYGTTTAYGSVAPAVPASIGAGSTSVAVSQPITGLEPATTYHFRLVAFRATERVEGQDRVLTTAGLPPPPDEEEPPDDGQPPDDGGGGGGGGAPGSGGASGSGTGGGGTPGGGGAPATSANSLADITVERCRQTGRGRRTRLRCALRDAEALRSARMRLTRSGRTVASAIVEPSGAGALTMRLRRKLAKGRYVLVLTLRDNPGNTRALRFRFRIRR